MGVIIKFTISHLLTLQIYNFSSPYLTDATYQIWTRLTELSIWEDDVDAPQISHNDGRQPIAIGHQSDSGDLKTQKVEIWNSEGWV